MTTLNLQVGAGGDDGIYGISPTSYFGTTDTNAIAGTFSSSSQTYGSWFRFTGVSGLSGQTVSSATLELWGHAADSGTPLTKIRAERAEAPANPSNQADAEGRTKTTAKVDWDSPGLSTAGYTSKDITTVIQELADNHDPSVIIIYWEDDGSDTGGNNVAQARAWNNSAGAYAAKLTITHAPPTATGTGAPSLWVPTLAGTGEVAFPGTGAWTVEPVSLAGTGQMALYGTGALSLFTPSLAATGEVVFTATGALTIPAIVELSGAGELVITGSGAPTIPSSVVLSGSGSLVPVGAASPSLFPPTLAATGEVVFTATAALAIPSIISLSGSGSLRPDGSGEWTLQPASLSGSGWKVTTGSKSSSRIPWPSRVR